MCQIKICRRRRREIVPQAINLVAQIGNQLHLTVTVVLRFIQQALCIHQIIACGAQLTAGVEQVTFRVHQHLFGVEQGFFRAQQGIQRFRQFALGVAQSGLRVIQRRFGCVQATGLLRQLLAKL